MYTKADPDDDYNDDKYSLDKMLTLGCLNGFIITFWVTGGVEWYTEGRFLYINWLGKGYILGCENTEEGEQDTCFLGDVNMGMNWK